jgi:hypothetical protein
LECWAAWPRRPAGVTSSCTSRRPARDIQRLPLVEGRFQFNVSLTDGARTRRYHNVEKAAEFSVTPQGEAHGFVLFEGEWSLEQATPALHTDAGQAEIGN